MGEREDTDRARDAGRAEEQEIRATGGEDGEDFGQLFKEHNDVLVRFLAAQLGNEDEAQDAAQEAYVRILGLNRSTVVSHFRAYLFRTARNIAIDRLRQRRRRAAAPSASIDEETVICPQPVSDEILLGREKLEILRLAIEELPPKCRYAFLQIRVGGATCGRIAAKLGVTENMVRRYIVRAVRHCKSRVEG